MAEYSRANCSKTKFFANLWESVGYYDFNTLLDVGGGENPIKHATHVIDYLPYENRRKAQGDINCSEKFTKDTWIQQDFYDLPWAYSDNFFDFVNCTQTLEDIRDPISICKEIKRVGKAGFIECPNIISELAQDFFHHRWFVRVYEGKLQFLHKSPNLVMKQQTLTDIKALFNKRQHADRATAMLWNTDFIAEEVYCSNEQEYKQAVIEWIEHDLTLHGGL